MAHGDYFRLVSNISSYVMIHRSINTLSENDRKHLFLIIFSIGVHKLRSDPAIESMGIVLLHEAHENKTINICSFLVLNVFAFFNLKL